MRNVTQMAVVFVLLSRFWRPSDSFGISIDENGYRDIRVSFPRNVSHDIRWQLIEATKELFNSSSTVLYVATKRRAYFRSVTFIIPRSWGDEKEWLEDVNVTVHRNHWDLFDKADIVVTNAMTGSKPLTLHSEGCQRKGVRIYFPKNFLISELDQRTKDLYFLHQWAQFRYGVFEEGGFEDDDRFPLYYGIPGSKEALVTSCTDGSLQYKFTDEDGNDCKPEVDFESGRPSGTKCFYSPIPANATLRSSLMYQQSLPWAYRFCEADSYLDKGHNPTTPSKHNALCNEEGTWFVILRSPDFLNGRNQASKNKFSPVSFKYVQEPSSIKVIIALEGSKYMQDHNRYNQMKNALAKFILYDLPVDCKFGVVYYNDDVVPLDFPFILTSTETRNSFLEFLNIPEEPGSSSFSCPMCALNTSIQMLESEGAVEGGIVVLVTTGSCEAEFKDSLKKELVDKGVRLFVILYQRQTRQDCNWDSLASVTGGLVFGIAESSSTWTALEQLYMSFASVIKGFSWTPEEHVLIAREMLEAQENISLQISVDKFIGEELRLFITGANFSIQNPPLLADYTSITVGNATVVTEFRRQPFLPAWIFEINPHGTDVITLTSKRNRKTSDPILVIVSGKSRPNDAGTISATAWFVMDDQQLVTSDIFPVKLYAEVTLGNAPIVEAEVIADISHPDGSVQSRIALHDNGAGDPDITRYDGIYSAYFSNYTSAGCYTVMLKVSSNGMSGKIRRVNTENCCGSTMPYSGEEPTGYFVRYVGPLSFLRIKNPPIEDKYPPNRILDLRLINFDGEQMKCTLCWTEAGENYTEGKASSYQIKVFVDRTDLRRNFDALGMQIEDPRDINWTSTGVHGSLVQCDVRLPEVIESDYFYIGVRAVDISNNTGKVSNTVQIYVGDRKSIRTKVCEDVGTDEGNSGSWNHLDLTIVVITLLLSLIKYD